MLYIWLYYMISYIILYHIILYYILSYYVILNYIISYLIVYHIISYIILSYIRLYYITYCIKLYYIILYYIILCYITLYYTILYYITFISIIPISSSSKKDSPAAKGRSAYSSHLNILRCPYTSETLDLEYLLWKVRGITNHPFGNGLYHPFMVIWGMVYCCFTRITPIDQLHPHLGRPDSIKHDKTIHHGFIQGRNHRSVTVVSPWNRLCAEWMNGKGDGSSHSAKDRPVILRLQLWFF